MGDEIDRERFKWPDLDALDVAKQDGNYAPLAAYLRTEHPLHPNTREWLARHLLDELPPRKDGNPQQRKPLVESWHLFSTVIQRMDRESVSQEQALRDYADETGETIDAVRSRYKRARRRWQISE